MNAAPTDMNNSELLDAVWRSEVGVHILRERAERADQARQDLAQRAAELRAAREAYEAETKPEFERVTREFLEAKERLERLQVEFDQTVARRADRIQYMQIQEAELRGEAVRLKHPSLQEMFRIVDRTIAGLEGRVHFDQTFRVPQVDGVGPRPNEWRAIHASIDRLRDIRNELGAIAANVSGSVPAATAALWKAHSDVFGPMPEWMIPVDADAPQDESQEAATRDTTRKSRSFLNRLRRT